MLSSAASAVPEEREALIDQQTEDGWQQDQDESRTVASPWANICPRTAASATYLDGLRGLAALSVFQQHRFPDWRIMHGFGESGTYFYLCSLPFFRVFTNGGASAVAIFFVLSGYAISHSTLTRISHARRSAALWGLLSASVRRPFRLYLPCWAVGLFVACLMQLPGQIYPDLWWSKAQDNLCLELKHFAFATVTYFQPFQTHATDVALWPYDAVVWTIPVQLKASYFVYLLLALLSSLLVSPNQSVLGLIVLKFALLQTGWWALGCFTGGLCLAITHSYDIDERYLFNKIGNKWRQCLLWQITLVSWYLLSQPRYEMNVAASLNTPGWHYLTRLIPAVYGPDRYYRYWQSIGATQFVWACLRLEPLQSALEWLSLRYVGRLSFMLYLIHAPLSYCLFDPYIKRMLGRFDQGVRAEPIAPSQPFDNWLRIPDVGPVGATLRDTVEWAICLSITLVLSDLATSWIDTPCSRVANWATAKIMGCARRAKRKQTDQPVELVDTGVPFQVEGCCHGELDTIYATLADAEQKAGKKVELLLICGDFQALRNNADLQCLAVPDKFRKLGDFHKYYSGEAKAPVLTIVIGGNHEASNYMWELFHGGWVAPSIYYLGKSGSVLVNGLRISGSSGIFHDKHYTNGYFETVPYDSNSIRSTYHTRQFDIARLSHLASEKVDIFMSHDWPQTIEQHGDCAALLRAKPFFRDDIRSQRLGSPPLMDMLRTLRPTLWFAAHLHVKFSAIVKHDGSRTLVKREQRRPKPASAPMPVALNPDEINLDLSDGEGEGPGDNEVSLEAATQPDAVIDESMDLAAVKRAALAGIFGAEPIVEPDSADNPDEISIDMDEDFVDNAAQPIPNPPKEEQSLSGSIQSIPRNDNATKFLALSKCLYSGQFLQLLEVPSTSDTSPPAMTFDPHWLAITKAFHPHMSSRYKATPLPQNTQEMQQTISVQLDWVRQNLPNGGLVPVEDVQKFAKTAPSASDAAPDLKPASYLNPQTRDFADWLQIANKVNQYRPTGAP